MLGSPGRPTAGPLAPGWACLERCPWAGVGRVYRGLDCSLRSLESGNKPRDSNRLLRLGLTFRRLQSCCFATPPKHRGKVLPSVPKARAHLTLQGAARPSHLFRATPGSQRAFLSKGPFDVCFESSLSNIKSKST